MTLPTGSERDIEDAKRLLGEYSFDLSGFQPGELVAIWRERLEADPIWIRSAVLEALYQGRYKAFSVEQILQGWKRRGHPIRHFNSEFERIVLGPIDTTISKYASMTSLRPSELMAPQQKRTSRTDSTSGVVIKTDRMTPDAIQCNTLEKPSQPESGQTDMDPGGKEHNAGISAEDASNNATDTPCFVNVNFSADVPAEGVIHSFSIFSQPEPIRKFIPQSEGSGFYNRLQSVARHFT